MPRPAGRSTQNAIAGSRTAATSSIAPRIEAGNPKYEIASTSAGVTRMPPELAPLSARLIASGRFRLNQSPTTLLMAPTCMVAAPAAITM